MIGETIGNFKLVSRLGKGGMGEVFLAEHVTMQTPAAVKILNEDISADHEHVQRFFNEMRVVSKIKHSGTVKIFDSGFFKQHAYLVMELLDGDSLAKRIAQAGPMPLMQLVDVAAQIASVLDAVHRSGFTHRDLKPDNIYLVHDDERASGERIKVLDFGIAKLTNTMASTGPKTVGTMGTPGYMAPEQWGDSSKVDWRADAYALGCVVYECATGRPPFICNSIPEAYAKHLNEIPAPLSSHRGDVPPALDHLLAQLLAKDPRMRASSMTDVANAFASVTGRAATGPYMAVQGAPFPAAPTLTTMGGSAAEMRSTQQAPRSKKALLWGALTGFVVVGGIIVAAVVASSGGSETAGSSSAKPAAEPVKPEPPKIEPAAKPPEPAAKPPEPAAKPPEPAAKPPEPAAKPPEPPAPTTPPPPPVEPAKPATPPPHHHTQKPKPPQQKPPEQKPPEQKPPQQKPPQQKPPAGDDDLGGRT